MCGFADVVVVVVVVVVRDGSMGPRRSWDQAEYLEEEKRRFMCEE